MKYYIRDTVNFNLLNRLDKPKYWFTFALMFKKNGVGYEEFSTQTGTIRQKNSPNLKLTKKIHVWVVQLLM